MKSIAFPNLLSSALAALMLFAAPAALALPTAPAAEAHMLSCKQERAYGAKLYNKAVKGHDVHEATGGVAAIQDRLIEKNSDCLNYEDKKHKRYLARTMVDETPASPNAFMAPGGRSVIYAKEIDIDRTYDRAARIEDDARRGLGPADYSARSNIAATLAHEYGHYANEDFLKSADRHMAIAVAFACIPSPATLAADAALTAGLAAGNLLTVRQESFNAEADADATSLDFLDNVPEYSMGSAITTFHRYEKYLRSTGGKDSSDGVRNFINPHSKSDTRIQRVRDHIKDVSLGRVTLDADDRLTVDGQLVFGTGYLADADRADSRERTVYLAGQIAGTMKRHLFRPGYLCLMRECDFAPGGSENRTVLVVADHEGKTEGHGTIMKVLGTFDYPKGTADRLLTAAQRKAKAELQAVWDLTRTLRARMKA